MYQIKEEDLHSIYFDTIAVVDFMRYINAELGVDKVDKDVLRVFANSLDRAVKTMQNYMEQLVESDIMTSQK